MADGTSKEPEYLAANEDGADRQTRVFISYSRKDLAFAETLVACLIALGFEAYLDKKDILPSEPWRERLTALIAGSDAVAFLISPDSVRPTSVCDWELNETERMGKRLLPLVVRRAEEVPSRLSRLNWIYMDTGEALEPGLEALASVLTRDIGWIREHTRLGELAARWTNARNKNEYALLRGKDIDDAELWISSQPKLSPETPEVTPDQRAFIQESRRTEQAQAERARQQIARTAWFQRWFGRALAGLGVLLAMGLLGVIWQDIETTKREQAVFLNPVDRSLGEQQYERAMRYALASYPAKGSWPWTPLSTALEGKLGAAAVLTRLQLTMAGRGGAVGSAAFSPDGTRIVTASNDNTARIWDAATGREIAALKGHCLPDQNYGALGCSVNSASFSPDGKWVVTASDDKTARLWDAATGREIAVLREHLGVVTSASFSPDGTRIITAGDYTARVWDTAGRELYVLHGHGGQVRSAMFSPDGTRIVTASLNGSARLWDASTGKEIAVLYEYGGAVASAMFSPDGTRIVTAPGDKTASLWDATTGREIVVLKEDCPPRQDFRLSECLVTSAAFSHDGTRVVTTSQSQDNTARVWDTATGKEIAVLKGHEDWVNSAAFSPDGTRVVTASRDRTARLWDAATGTEIAILKGHKKPLLSVAFSPDGMRIVSASEDNTTRLWNAAAGKESAVLKGHCPPNLEYPFGCTIFSAMFSPDGKRVVTASNDTTARIWDAATGREIAILRGHLGIVTSAAFSPGGTRVVTASNDNTARIWDAATGVVIAVLEGHEELVESAAFSPDGTRVVTASGDKTARIWDAVTGTEIAVLRGHENDVINAAFNLGGTRIVTLSRDNTARVWDAVMGTAIAVLKGHEDRVWSAAFNPDGTRIVTASDDKTARLWDATTGREIAELRGFESWVLSAAFSPDGTRIVTAAIDSTRIWDAAAGTEITVLGHHAAKSASFSPDGTRVVTVSQDDTLHLWDVASGAEIAVLRGYKDEVSSATFSPDGTRVVAVYTDRSVGVFAGSADKATAQIARIWDVGWATAIHDSVLRDRVCARILIGAQEFTDEELDDPILSSFDKDDPIARNPCSRRGPLDWEYYAQVADRWRRWAHKRWAIATTKSAPALTAP